MAEASDGTSNRLREGPEGTRATCRDHGTDVRPGRQGDQAQGQADGPQGRGSRQGPGGALMPKKAKELSPLAVGRLTEPGFWFVGGVAGLALQVTESGARSWILRVMVGGKRRDIGLGGYPDVPLADARRKARET